jgi:uncharacterized protein YfaT (DUF1175 family)
MAQITEVAVYQRLEKAPNENLKLLSSSESGVDTYYYLGLSTSNIYRAWFRINEEDLNEGNWSILT